MVDSAATNRILDEIVGQVAISSRAADVEGVGDVSGRSLDSRRFGVEIRKLARRQGGPSAWPKIDGDAVAVVGRIISVVAASVPHGHKDLRPWRIESDGVVDAHGAGHWIPFVDRIAELVLKSAPYCDCSEARSSIP